MESTRAVTAQFPLKSRSKWPPSGRQLPVNQRQNTDPACSISFSVGQVGTNDNIDLYFRSIKFLLNLDTGNENRSEVKKISSLIGHCTAWKNSEGSVWSLRHCAAGLAEVDAHLSGTDSGSTRVNTPVLPLCERELSI